MPRGAVIEPRSWVCNAGTLSARWGTLLFQGDSTPGLVGDVYTYREGSMDIQDGIDRQAKTLYKGEGVYQYIVPPGKLHVKYV